MKRWKCTVCNYIHVGDEPPEVCPVCGVGREKFVELVDDLQADEPSSAGGDDRTASRGFLTEQIIKRHVHPMSVHAPNGVIPLTVTFVFLAAIFGIVGLAEAAFYNLIFVLISLPVVWISGIVEWREKYGGELTRSFVAKLVSAGVVTVAVAALAAWQVVSPDAPYGDAFSQWPFLLLNAIMLAATMVAGFIGGKLVFKD